MIELAWIVAATVAQAAPSSPPAPLSPPTAGTPPVDAPAAAVKFAKPRLLTSGFGAEPRWPLVADLDGDGFGDLIAVDPAAGIVDVARSVRGGKFLGPVNAASEPGPVTSASVLKVESGRAELVLARAAGSRVVSFGEDGIWNLRDLLPASIVPAMPTATAGATSNSSSDAGTGAGAGATGERRVFGDFDGDGAFDQIVGTTLRLAADHEHPCEVAALASLPPGAVVVAGDVSGDKRDDLVVFRRDDAWRSGRDVLALVAYRDGDVDCDGDGLDLATEQRWKSDPLDADTDHDGLLDGWEVRGEGALDLPALGASPVHKDCFVYVQRYFETDGALCTQEMARVVKTWAELPNPNPDGTTGIALHPIWLPPLPPGAPGRAWWDLGNEHLPKAARGLAHYMIVGPGGGGQAAELGDMGGCGQAAMWACFLHEFGHQVGLSHTGGPEGGGPTYTSLMNYNYSYGFNDDGNQIHYSRGALASLVVNESRLSERLAFPHAALAFLEKGPYRFKLQSEGDSTRIDWNRDGKFDDGTVRADIDDVYGVGAGRFGVGKTSVAPVLLEHGGSVVLIGASREKRLYRRRLRGPSDFDPESWIDSVKPIGDPAAVIDDSGVLLLVPTEEGIAALAAAAPEGLDAATPELLPETKGLSVSAARFAGRALVLFWKDESTPIAFLTRDAVGAFGAARPLTATLSTIPPAAAEDPATGELLLGFGAKRGEPGKERVAWRLARLRANDDGTFTEVSQRPVGDENCGWYGDSRPMLLVESSPAAVAEGRIHFIGKGTGSAPNFNQCSYEAITIGDKTQNDGWRLRRFCDEWSQTRSPIGACFRRNDKGEGDLVVVYRWFGNVHGDEDDDVHVLWNAYGITDADMRDYDDVSSIADLGLERSILWRDPAAR